MEKIKGVYAIINMVNQKKYVGSSNNIKKRWISHKTRLNNSTHHSDFLQRAWNKYGKDNFTLIILEVLSSDNTASDIFIKEQEWIDRLLPEYNVGSVGGGDNLTNHPRRDEIIQKISKTIQQRVINMTEDDKEKIRQNFLGDKNPNWRGGVSYAKGSCVECGAEICKDHTRCIICAKKGKNNPFHGKQHSDESKKRISEAHKGKYNGNQRKKISINGIIYESCSAAAKAINVSGGLITYRIKKGYEGYNWVL
jgi:group I intron endonuclease